RAAAAGRAPAQALAVLDGPAHGGRQEEMRRQWEASLSRHDLGARGTRRGGEGQRVARRAGRAAQAAARPITTGIIYNQPATGPANTAAAAPDSACFARKTGSRKMSAAGRLADVRRVGGPIRLVSINPRSGGRTTRPPFLEDSPMTRRSTDVP